MAILIKFDAQTPAAAAETTLPISIFFNLIQCLQKMRSGRGERERKKTGFIRAEGDTELEESCALYPDWISGSEKK